MVGEIRIRLFNKLEFRHVQDLRKTITDENFCLKDPNLFFNFLLEQGYLKIIRIEVINKVKFADIKVPNEEIEIEFRDRLHCFFENYDLNECSFK